MELNSRTALRITTCHKCPGLASTTWCRKSLSTPAHMQEQFLEGAIQICPFPPDCCSLPAWFGAWEPSAELGWCPGMAEGLCPCLWKRQMAHGQDLMIQLCYILPTELKTPGIILDCLCGPDKRCKKVKRDLASGKFGYIFCPSTGRCKVPVNALLFWQQQESDTKVIKGWELYPCV